MMTENIISFWFDVLSTRATVTVHILQIPKNVSFWVVHPWQKNWLINTTTTDISKKYTSIKVHVK